MFLLNKGDYRRHCEGRKSVLCIEVQSLMPLIYCGPNIFIFKYIKWHSVYLSTFELPVTFIIFALCSHFLAPLEDLISQTMDGTSATAVAAQTPTHEATRELSSLYFFE